ncbi:cuticle protein-like [Penaeus monodon]|uniref:cuticle protein-like n=1 Tax=Penaeus monodon TaxID=6687 RepID=UPI0018A729BA|nr:cuticle protein-like [Penaeus monodon]
MNTKVVILLGLVAVAVADSRESYEYLPARLSSEESAESYESGEAKYSFNWAVSDDSSSNEFGHQEARDGDHTQGSYYVQLPDGRLQTVKYFVDGDSGYVAEVSYEGEASYPDSHESFEAESAESAESVESREYRPPRPQYVYDSNESK